MTITAPTTTTRTLDHDPFLRALLTTPAGREHLLSIAVDAEEGDEAGLFDQIADAVDVPELRRVVEAHRDDEVRHARMYRECLARNGYTKRELPASLSLIDQLREGVEDPAPTLRTPDDIMWFYALLFVIEERGVERFPLIADAFERHDPETAETYRRVTRDERGHIRYCERIGRHYAASDEAWAEAVAVSREIEAAAFARAERAQLAYCIEQGLVDISALSVAT
jgi:rubrerythrin